MIEYWISIFINDEPKPNCPSHITYDYESAVTYVAQNPLSSTTEEYRIGVPCYDNEEMVGIMYLYPHEIAEDVEKIKKGESLDYDNDTA